MKKGFLTIFAILGAFLIPAVVGGIYYLVQTKIQPQTSTNPQEISTVLPTPVSTPFVFRSYNPPNIESKDTYTIFLLGDSMTHALGPHGGSFYTFINELYKNHNKGVLVDNYAVGSKSILSLDELMTTKATYWDSTFEPLLSREFDLVLVESFGYNPLSQLAIDEGLKRQTAVLDALMTTLITTHGNSAIVFVATIAPSKANYAKNVLFNLTAEQRTLQAEERMAYIKNHINYAQSHNIPVINIFEKSLNDQGDGDLKYINPDDYIHPSFIGVDFIGQEIANFVYVNQILPI